MSDFMSQICQSWLGIDTLGLMFFTLSVSFIVNFPLSVLSEELLFIHYYQKNISCLFILSSNNEMIMKGNSIISASFTLCGLKVECLLTRAAESIGFSSESAPTPESVF